ncbi:MAG: tyrosine-type recombinase/integrase [Nitrospiraceae bacterium]|nr:tyrosine-type recombinase/integrase [Nitrospiraceae bacterium]
MKGTIRPISSQSKCPTCKRLFEEVSKIGYICKEHMTIPRKFYIDLWHEGTRIRIFTNKYDNPLDSYSAAKSLLKQINTDIDNRTFDPTHFVRKDRENYYLEARWNEFVKKHTNRKYSQQLDFAKGYIFRHFSISHDIRDIKQSDITLFAEALPGMAKKGLGGKSIKNIVGVLLSLINYNHSLGVTSSKLTLPKIEVTKKVKNIPEVSESLKIISHIPEECRLIFLFLITHLCRPADARALQARHFDFENNTVTIELGFSGNVLSSTKTKKPYTIPLHAALRERIRDLCITCMPNDFVFTYEGKRWAEAKIREIWNAAAVKAGSVVTFYNGVKHASVSHAANESGDIYSTSKLTGHTNIRTTQIYADKTRLEKLRKIQETIVIPEGLL